MPPAKQDMTVSPPLDGGFQRQVKALVKEGESLTQAYDALTTRILDFATRFKEATELAKKLDEGEEEGSHSVFLITELQGAIGTSNPSIWSRWNTIGAYAKQLKQYTPYLPANRDSLYEAALALKERKSFKNWIKTGQLNHEASVRDIRALRKPEASSSRTASKGAQKKHKNAAVTLFFDSYEQALEALYDLIVTRRDVELSAHHAFVEALRAKVDDDEYQKIEKRIRLIK